MPTVKGQNLRIFVNDSVLAASRQCTLGVHLSVQSMSSKDQDVDVTPVVVTSLSWDMRASGLIVIDPERNDTDAMLSMVGATVRVEFALATGDTQQVNSDAIISGDAVISDISLGATVRAESTYDIILTGKSDMLFPLGVLTSSDQYRLVTSDGRQLAVEIDDNDEPDTEE